MKIDLAAYVATFGLAAVSCFAQGTGTTQPDSPRADTAGAGEQKDAGGLPPTAGPAAAPPATEFAPGGETRGPDFRLNFSGGYSPSADIDGGGDVSRWIAGTDADLSIPLNQALSLNFGAGVSRTFYDFGGENELPGNGDPWGDVTYINLSAGLSVKLDQQWRAFGSFTALSAGEDGADFGDTWTFGGVGGATYSFSKDLTLGLALVVQERLEDDLFILPFPIIDWVLPFDEQGRWRLSVGSRSRVGVAAGGAGVSFTPSDQWTFSAGIGGIGLGGEFRLDEDGPVPGGVARDNFVSALFGIDYRPVEWASLAGFVGVAFAGELEVLDAGGTRVVKRDVDPSPVFGLSINFEF